MNKVRLQTYLYSMIITPTKKINMTIYFKFLIIGLHFFKIFLTHAKFCTNQILFIYYSMYKLNFLYIINSIKKFKI